MRTVTTRINVEATTDSKRTTHSYALSGIAYSIPYGLRAARSPNRCPSLCGQSSSCSVRLAQVPAFLELQLVRDACGHPHIHESPFNDNALYGGAQIVAIALTELLPFIAYAPKSHLFSLFLCLCQHTIRPPPHATSEFVRTDLSYIAH